MCHKTAVTSADQHKSGPFDLSLLIEAGITRRNIKLKNAATKGTNLMEASADSTDLGLRAVSLELRV